MSVRPGPNGSFLGDPTSRQPLDRVATLTDFQVLSWWTYDAVIVSDLKKKSIRTHPNNKLFTLLTTNPHEIFGRSGSETECCREVLRFSLMV